MSSTPASQRHAVAGILFAVAMVAGYLQGRDDAAIRYAADRAVPAQPAVITFPATTAAPDPIPYAYPGESAITKMLPATNRYVVFLLKTQENLWKVRHELREYRTAIASPT